jgi:hypothetical protein
MLQAMRNLRAETQKRKPDHKKCHDLAKALAEEAQRQKLHEQAQKLGMKLSR